MFGMFGIVGMFGIFCMFDMFCIFCMFGMFLYLEGGQTISLQDLYFWYLRGGYCFSCFSFGVALLISYVAKYGLNGLSPASSRHTYIYIYMWYLVTLQCTC